MQQILLKISHGENLIFFSSEEKTSFSIGGDQNVDDIFISSPILSNRHLLFTYNKNKWIVTNKSDSNNVLYGRRGLKAGKSKKAKVDKILDIENKDLNEKITLSSIKNIRQHKDFLFKSTQSGKANSILSLTSKNEFFIGRDPSCDIVINNPQVDLFNTKIVFDGYDYFVQDLKSANGTCVNNEQIKIKRLTNYDFINIPTAVYMFLNDKLVYAKNENGIDIDVVGISKVVTDLYSKKPLTLVNDASMQIKAGEFVAIVGGSGAGKSTILDAINGRRPATSGKVYYDLNDYYSNILTYQSIIGYVPQRDIMHENLTIAKTLYYYAAIRMRHNLKKEEIVGLCRKAMKDVSLLEKANVKVASLSGGQKKRVSIAMELLSDPKVIFLDEPTSGLSPDLDHDLMCLLSDLAEQGRTIVVITHAMDNVDKCDKIAFLGKGGRLCYYGKPSKIFSYFDLKKYAQIFSLLSGEQKSIEYAEKFKLSENYEIMQNTFSELYLSEEGK